ncbi:MAG TPA: hypothetical protein VNS32_24310 [Flavisolibacter sp.]|nr:hypothetical protein [Flavisolibacter sp.]
MGLQILVQYRETPVIFNVSIPEEDVYQLRLFQQIEQGAYIPEKITIRKKGKIWISDIEDHGELINALTAEIVKFNANS